MRVKTREEGSILVIELSGKIQGPPETEDFHDRIKDLVAKGHKRFLINLKGVSWLSSLGLGMLLAARATILKAGGRMCLAHVTDRIESIFMVTETLNYFDCHETEAEALTAIG
ncbi:MAG: anti-sigma factor antagonist [Candidatus Krumholzibacteriota bacterium]|nr:anti-sigma factor antagonist [Candidatus Krumholzibacteriota bacterium]